MPQSDDNIKLQQSRDLTPDSFTEQNRLTLLDKNVSPGWLCATLLFEMSSEKMHLMLSSIFNYLLLSSDAFHLMSSDAFHLMSSDAFHLMSSE
jgi:hypothetical protein